jgi:hypothetical protein
MTREQMSVRDGSVEGVLRFWPAAWAIELSRAARDAASEADFAYRAFDERIMDGFIALLSSRRRVPTASR